MTPRITFSTIDFYLDAKTVPYFGFWRKSLKKKEGSVFWNAAPGRLARVGIIDRI